MEITTNAIALSPFTFFKLALFRHYENKKWMLLALIFGFFSYAMLISYASVRYQYIGIFSYGIMLTFFLIIPIFYWHQTTLMKARGFFLPRSYRFNDEEISSRVEGGRMATYAWKKVKRVHETAKYYLLYFSHAHFLYVQKDAFKSAQDHAMFEDWLSKLGLSELEAS